MKGQNRAKVVFGKTALCNVIEGKSFVNNYFKFAIIISPNATTVFLLLA